MKFILDEKLKHRLVGLAVIISLGAIFAPAVMRKSSQRVDGNFSVNIKLPTKPLAPDVVITDEKDMFKTIKISRVAVPAVSEDKQLPEVVNAATNKSEQLLASNSEQELASNKDSVIEKVDLTKAQPIQLAVNDSAKAVVKQVTQVAAKKALKQLVPVNKLKVTAQVKRPAVVAKAITKPVAKQDIYALQLASFSQVTNAQALVYRLKTKGYKANYIRTVSSQGAIYKVYAGHSSNKDAVLRLKSQLASAMQLNGFIVNTGVS